MTYKVTIEDKTGRYEAETEQKAAQKCARRRFAGSDGLVIDETHIDGNQVQVCRGPMGHIGKPVTVYGSLKYASQGCWTLGKRITISVEATA